MRIKWFSLIRITGLLLVLLYHFFQTIFPGGFFGVDVFFTFSGFLITSLLLEEFGKAHQIEQEVEIVVTSQADTKGFVCLE